MMWQPLRIAVTGRLRSGKDSVADILQERDYFTVYRFADGITDIIEQYFSDDLKIGKPREHYQVIGQSLRQLDENVWVKALHRKRQLGHVIHNELITDVRQPNEVKYCEDHGFKIIKVVADEEIRKQRAFHAGDTWVDSQLQHPTERAVDCIVPDYQIHNNGTFDELVEKVNAVYQQILQEVSE